MSFFFSRASSEDDGSMGSILGARSSAGAPSACEAGCAMLTPRGDRRAPRREKAEAAAAKDRGRARGVRRVPRRARGRLAIVERVRDGWPLLLLRGDGRRAGRSVRGRVARPERAGHEPRSARAAPRLLRGRHAPVDAERDARARANRRAAGARRGHRAVRARRAAVRERSPMLARRARAVAPTTARCDAAPLRADGVLDMTRPAKPRAGFAR